MSLSTVRKLSVSIPFKLSQADPSHCSLFAASDCVDPSSRLSLPESNHCPRPLVGRERIAFLLSLSIPEKRNWDLSAGGQSIETLSTLSD